MSGKTMEDIAIDGLSWRGCAKHRLAIRAEISRHVGFDR